MIAESHVIWQTEAMIWRFVLAACALVLLSGCVARAIADVATAPVRVAGKAADLATTSQSEADEKRGRAMRKREERLGELDRRYRQHDRECSEGNDSACTKRDATAEEIDRLRSYRD